MVNFSTETSSSRSSILRSTTIIDTYSLDISKYVSFSLSLMYSRYLAGEYSFSYCLDITVHPDGQIGIRDGAFSLFDKGKVMEDLTPIQGFKVCLS